MVEISLPLPVVMSIAGLAVIGLLAIVCFILMVLRLD